MPCHEAPCYIHDDSAAAAKNPVDKRGQQTAMKFQSELKKVPALKPEKRKEKR